jgi:hypothetical protein
MKAISLYLTVGCLAGLGFSTWHARPADVQSLEGWGFAAYASLAWILVVLLSLIVIPRVRRWGVAGAFLALVVSETCLFLLSADPLILAIKPFYQVPLLLIGYAVGAHLSPVAKDASQ